MSVTFEDKIGDIRNLIDAGFYPEEYHKFSREVENLLSDIEEMETQLHRDLRRAKQEALTEISNKATPLDLYPEDFEKTHDWVAVCEQLGVDSSSLKIKISVLSAQGVDNE